MRFRWNGLSLDIRRISSLADDERDAIWSFAARFTDATREGFEQSFTNKRDAVLIKDARTGELVGLGGVAVEELPLGDSRCVVIFPGDTLFDPKVRGKSLVQGLGLLYYLECRLKRPTLPVYMVYGTFSYKSYLMLPRNFRTFWPRQGAPMPAREQALLRDVAERFYLDVRERAGGALVARTTKRLREGVATVDEAALRDPDIRYFHEQNPGYTDGEVLLCLIPLHTANWLSVGRNVLRRRVRATAR